MTNNPLANSSRPAALERFRTGGYSGPLVAPVIAYIAWRYYAPHLAATYQPAATCGGRPMSPGDLCRQRPGGTFGYERALELAHDAHQASLIAAPVYLAAIGVWFIASLLTVPRVRDVPDTPNSTWHASPASTSLFAFIPWGIGAIVLFVSFRDGGWSKIFLILLWIPVVVGLYVFFPRPARLVRVDDDGVLAVRGLRRTWIPWGEVHDIEVREGRKTTWRIRHSRGTTSLNSELSSAPLLGQRLRNR
ncbi:PH domain-containing protein [Tessaracoccus massiliensis]|uniref:PH domain-containing protein n=1 Tax=Tessaracoccus massiliensis TaxID=1522311 RepID=UPI000591001B|nr:PH domain-containing protein [Tessaracoccus massiliensis]